MLADRELARRGQTTADLQVDLPTFAVLCRRSSTSDGLATAWGRAALRSARRDDRHLQELSGLAQANIHLSRSYAEAGVPGWHQLGSARRIGW